MDFSKGMRIMSGYKILYNPKSNNKQGKSAAQGAVSLINGAEHEYIDWLSITDKQRFFDALREDDKVILCGGDGSLNHLINEVDTDSVRNEVYLYATGTGNDFVTSIGGKPETLIPLNEYLRGLPTVTVNGKEYRFINGVGFGIDGYCCEVGDDLKDKSDKPINYTSIAIKGLLFHFKPVNATVTVDGKVERYKKVWLAPTMYGTCYGGGMFPTPDQKRGEGKASTMVYYGKGKIRSLMVFPSIFKGEHVSHTDMVKIFTGRTVSVRFDSPTALQIDGETIRGVTEYSVRFK